MLDWGSSASTLPGGDDLSSEGFQSVRKEASWRSSAFMGHPLPTHTTLAKLWLFLSIPVHPPLHSETQSRKLTLFLTTQAYPQPGLRHIKDTKLSNALLGLSQECLRSTLPGDIWSSLSFLFFFFKLRYNLHNINLAINHFNQCNSVAFMPCTSLCSHHLCLGLRHFPRSQKESQYLWDSHSPFPLPTPL